MKSNLASLEIHYLLKELKYLIDSKIDKIYHPDKKELILQLHVPSKGKIILRIIAGKLFYLTETKESSGEPSGFCMFLRKHLNNARLREINQKESERIIELIFEKKEGIKKLIIELFAQGNILLLDKDDIILSGVEYKKFRDREVRPQVKYEYPKMKYNLLKLKVDDLKELIKTSNKESIVKSLAVELGFGGTYSEEVCLLSKIDKDTKPDKLKDNEIKKLFEAIKDIRSNKLNSFIVYKEDKIKDVVPFELTNLKELKSEKCETYNKALDFAVSKESLEEKKVSPKQKQIDKIKRIIEDQEKRIKELGKKEIDERNKGELIYNNYQLISEILAEIKKATKKYSWEEIKKKLKGHKVIKEVNTKDKKVTIEIS